MTERYYKALIIWCPECNAGPGDRCVGKREVPLRGVHRKRDLRYNELAWLESDPPKVAARRIR